MSTNNSPAQSGQSGGQQSQQQQQQSQSLSQFMEDRQNQLLPLSTQCSHFDYDFQRSQQADKVCPKISILEHVN